MKNKRGQFFALLIVFMVLAMPAYIILAHKQQVRNIEGAAISPVPVLNLSDSYFTYEALEEQAFLRAYEKSSDVASFRQEFFSLIETDFKIQEFLLKDLTINGNPAELTIADFHNYLENYLYPESEMIVEPGRLRIVRNPIQKEILLDSDSPINIKYPVTLMFDRGRIYEVP